MRRSLVLTLGGLATVAFTALWHGPIGAAERLAARASNEARAQLDHDEMTQVQAHLQRDPLSRRLLLSGPADDFQRHEIVRRMEALPAIGDAKWTTPAVPAETAP